MPPKRVSKPETTNSSPRDHRRRLRGEPALRIWREYRKLSQEQLARKSKLSRALIAAIETNRKSSSVTTWKKLGAALNVSWEELA